MTGIFIGKNGAAGLTALGAVKTFSKLKNVIIGSKSAKFSCLLKRTKPEITAIPAFELSFPSVSQSKGWHLPYQEGAIIESNFYNEHALGRISSDLSFNRSLLEAKAIEKSQELSIPFTAWEEFEKRTLIEQGKALSIDSRRIPPSVVETEIVNISSKAGKIEVFLDEKENIVTALHTTKIDKIFVRNLNTKKHIMQLKHAWDKLIKLTGNVEEDCEKVIKLLENNQIFSEKYRLKPVETFENFIRYNHQMKINGYDVKAIFNKNLETGEMFLNDAWIMIE